MRLKSKKRDVELSKTELELLYDLLKNEIFHLTGIVRVSKKKQLNEELETAKSVEKKIESLKASLA